MNILAVDATAENLVVALSKNNEIFRGRLMTEPKSITVKFLFW